MPAEAGPALDAGPDRGDAVGRAAATRLPPWMATVALLLPTYAWLALAVLLPLGAMLAVSFLSGTPTGKKAVVFTGRTTAPSSTSPISSASPGPRS